MSPASSRLRQLAGRLGIIPEYIDQTGRHVRRTTDATREALLSVMGFDTPSEDAAAGWLDELDHEAAETMIEPVRVARRDDRGTRQVRIRLPSDRKSGGDVELVLTEEGGQVWKLRKRIARSGVLELPTRVPYGYHRITVRVDTSGGERTAEQSFIVVPSSCITASMALGARDPRVMGVIANLYSLRREHDWGVGDFTTLTQLVEWAGARGAEFVGVNPLHALYNRGWDVSPYSPVSRLFRNALYIDVDAVPEVGASEAARAILNSPETRARLRALRESRLVDYEGVIALKLQVLAEAHRAFRAKESERRRSFDDFARNQDPELTRYAIWMSIAESSGIPDWRQWPAALQAPDDPAVQAFAAAHAERVDFHKWLQFECDRQLHHVAERSRALGMRIGAYQDLAIGTNPGGSDTWSYPDLFLSGANVGAPPDPYSAEGQNWGLPPMNPRALRAQCYRYWIELLRRAFNHAGALRIDHVMGLFRAFWIPEGLSGKEGAYVRMPSDDLLGILTLESVRHDALVVGEDLGTVPKDVPPALKRWGVLSSKVLYFERDAKGFKAARSYPSLSLATANTHDMPTLAGFWTERDIELRERVGLLPTSREIRSARRERAKDKEALLRRLDLSPPRHFEEPTFPRRLAGSVHDFLCSTPAQLVGVSLDDLMGEVDPVNVPGVGPDRYPSWRRRTRMTMEQVAWSFEVDDAMRCDVRRGKDGSK